MFSSLTIKYYPKKELLTKAALIQANKTKTINHPQNKTIIFICFNQSVVEMHVIWIKMFTKWICEYFTFCLIYNIHFPATEYFFYLQCHISLHMSHDHTVHCLVRCQRPLTYTVQASLISRSFWHSLYVNIHFPLQMEMNTCAVIACTI